MRTYSVNDREYATICSVHDEILSLTSKLEKQELLPDTLNDVKTIILLTEVAKQMGQNMEDAIRYKNVVTAGTIDFYSFQKYMFNREEDDE